MVVAAIRDRGGGVAAPALQKPGSSFFELPDDIFFAGIGMSVRLAVKKERTAKLPRADGDRRNLDPGLSQFMEFHFNSSTLVSFITESLCEEQYRKRLRE